MLSVALTVKLYVPVVIVGVPEMVLPVNVKPFGSEPAMIENA